MRTLIKLLQELDQELAGCIRCGLCLSVCPLFAETGREADVARGKLSLLTCLAQEMFQDSRGVSDRLNRCLLCGSCAANCPRGVRVVDIFLQARAILAGYQGLSPAKKIIFRGLLANPALFHHLVNLGATFQGFFVRPVDDLLGSSCARYESPLWQGRHFKPLAATPFHKQVSSLFLPPAPGQPTVALFVGCLIDKFFPEVGHAVLTVLKHHGIGVVLPGQQGCCGLPALSAGDTSTFQSLVSHNLGRFRGQTYDYLVSACATCTASLKNLWPLMAQPASSREETEITRWAEKAMDISEFLVDTLKIPPPAAKDRQPRATVTYHDPCHLRKSLGVAAQPRALLQHHPGLVLVEMAGPDRCCGCGGSFNLQNYDLSAAIGQHKVDTIIASGADLVATGCPACMLQIIDLLSRAGRRLQVKHTIELYAQAIQTGPELIPS